MLRELTHTLEDDPSPRSAEEVLNGLLETTQELHSATDLEVGLERVADRLRGSIPFDALGVLLLDDLGRELSFAFAVGYPEEVARHWRFGIGQGIVGTVARTRRPLRADDVRQERRYINASDSIRSELAVPLVSKDRTVGVLVVGSDRPSAFDAGHERLLSFLAGHLAAAIDNARLNRRMREQAQTLSLLHELAREFTAILDRTELLERVSVLLRRHVEFDLFGVLLWDEESQVLEPWLTLDADNRPVEEGLPLPLGHGICGTVAALRQAIRVPNVHLDPRYVKCVADIEVRSELAVPLLLKDRLLGVLLLDSSEYDAFTPRHEQLLSTLASSIAIALENARLYEKLQAEEARLESDLATAREVQKQLLPKATPWVSGLQIAVAYAPARHLAGDIYDFLPYGEGRTAVAVGDVAGKATSAALYGSLAVGMLREYAVQGRFPPARVLGDMNDKLRQLHFDNRFLAMTFAVYDAAERRLSLAGSGLPHPRRMRDGVVEPIPIEGVPLGLFPDQSYEQMDLELADGEVVVIYSDGVEEASDGEEEFGRERIDEVLRRHADASAPEIADALIAATDRFAGGENSWDDRTVVVLKVLGDAPAANRSP